MFRTLCIKIPFSGKGRKIVGRILGIVFVGSLLWTAGRIYYEKNSSRVLSLEDLTLSLPAPLQWKEADSMVVGSYLNYEDPEKELSFRYPEAFILRELYLAGGEIRTHLALQEKNGPLHGFIQIWHIQESLTDFLQKAKNAASPSIANWDERSLIIQGTPVTIWQYEVRGTEETTLAQQAFLQKGSDLLVLSLYAPKDRAPKDFEQIFQTMLYSIRFHPQSDTSSATYKAHIAVS